MKNFKHLLFLSILCSLVLFTNCGEDSEDPVADTPTNNTDDDNTDDGSTDPVNYTLTLTASEGGTVTPESGSFGENESVELLATPDSTYVFVNWTGSSTSTDNPLSVTMDSDKSYTANFVKKQYPLTIIIEGEGAVSEEIVTNGRIEDYDEGTVVQLTATPSEGWKFDQWVELDVNTNPLEVSITDSVTLTARFKALNLTEVTNNPEEFNYDITKDYTEKIVPFYPNAFFASDLSDNVINGVNLALKTAADEFGKYGPVEYWVFGADKQAALDLINKFCERREDLNQWNLSDCLSRETDETLDYSMIAYQKIGESLVSENRPMASAGHNGGFQWGIHKLTSSYPFTLDNYFDNIPYLSHFKVVIHEYFHVVQLASIYNLDKDVRDSKLMPDGAIWMMEGAAEYMAVYTLFKKIEDGTLNFDESQMNNYESLKMVMTNNMSSAKTMLSENCPEYELKDIKYGDCQQPVYNIGPWAVAYLLNKVNNQNILLDTFYPNLKELGFEGAFNLAFGFTTEEFYEEFEEFLQLPIEQQLEIIPDI
ncbi:hypothetical protein N9922_03335 [Cyclobacteriaceae bacterium]|nr:hypothetical protein [Cyclobacteriaceae bacterium]MDB4316411.1 hypothetical protein [Cyclobacteriaceae bacterium]MDB4742638.1 hypothetical protein [Cyclobacteriaceae bacterium]